MKHFRLITAFLSFACFAALSAAAQNFAPPVLLPISGYAASPYGIHIALADLNGDGLLDVVAVYPGQLGYPSFGSGSGSAQISFGDGKGGFATPSTNTDFPRGNSTAGPLNLALGDFNDDGRLDVICPISGGFSTGGGSSNGTPLNGTTIGVLFRNSAGTFGGPALFAVGDTPTAALVADFNHDNIPDVAVTNASGILTVYLGIGGGLYQGGAAYRVGGNPTAIRMGDFNHDGKPDLATVNIGDGSLSILINNGNGTFRKAKRLVIGANLRDAALADLNGDGRADIVALRSAKYPSFGEIDVFTNNADGTFTLSKTYSASNAATALLLADFSGSGNLDAITNDGILTRGIGSAAGNTALATYSGNLAVGDVNRDGKLDFVIGNQLYLNTGPSFSLKINFTLEAAPFTNFYHYYHVTLDFRSLSGEKSFQRSETVFGSQTISYDNLPSGDYTLHFECAHFLSVNVPVHLPNDYALDLSITLPTGDANGDNSVDSTDFGILIGAFNTNINNPKSGYDPTVDFNEDGSVDSTDFGLLIGNYGRQGDL